MFSSTRNQPHGLLPKRISVSTSTVLSDACKPFYCWKASLAAGLKWNQLHIFVYSMSTCAHTRTYWLALSDNHTEESTFETAIMGLLPSFSPLIPTLNMKFIVPGSSNISHIAILYVVQFHRLYKHERIHYRINRHSQRDGNYSIVSGIKYMKIHRKIFLSENIKMRSNLLCWFGNKK